MNGLYHFFTEQAAMHGGRTAIQHRPRYRTLRWSFEDLLCRAQVLSARLAQRGVGPGDRVLLFGENSPDWAAAFFAILGLGAVAVPMNPRSTADQVDRLATAAEAKLVMRSRHAYWPGSPRPELILQSAGGEPAALPLPAADTDGLAEIIFTSGTTGEPKGVMLTHLNLLADLAAVAQAVPLELQHHVLSLVPLFHAYGQMTGLLCPLRAGCTVSYVPAPTSRAILEVLRYSPVTHLVAVPEILKTMMDRLEARLGRLPGFLRTAAGKRLRRRVFGSLETVACGGAALDPAVEEKWRALGLEVLQGYGLTETSPVLAANTPANHRTGSVGRPVAGAEIRISAEGEILARGPMVTGGYYRDPARTEAAFTDGWFKTGDAGCFDQDGYLYIQGRRRYMILGPGGENVFPEDIEAELARVPGVIDSAVVGLEKAGRTVIHAVLLADESGAGAMVAKANEKLAPHQQIQSWSVWPEPDFPRSATRKVRKEEVIARLVGQALQRPEPEEAITPLRRLLAQVTGVSATAMDGRSALGADLGVDSLLRIELVARIEEQWGIALEELQIGPETTVAELEALVLGQSKATPKLGHYPRWSLRPWAGRLRPLAQKLFLESWLLPFCRLQVEGIGHLEEVQGPVVFMANHRSYLDSAIATFVLPAPYRWRLGIAAATEVLYRQYRWAVPLGELAMNAFPFPTGVEENIRPGIEYIGRLLDDGWNVLIFPEGRMNREDSGLLALKGGTGIIAVEMQVPVVPLVMQGTDKIMPPDMVIPRARGVVSVRFGRALRFSPEESYAGATARIQAAMRNLLAEGGGGV